MIAAAYKKTGDALNSAQVQGGFLVRARRRSPNTARRSGSSPTSPTPTTASRGRWSSPPSDRGRIMTKGWRTRKAVKLAPKDGNISNTLALAEYRAGHWNESIAASERSVALRNGGNAYDWLFRALAHWQKGEKDKGRTWFDKAVAWTKEKNPENLELRQIWAEAAQLLGRPGPDGAGEQPE